MKTRKQILVAVFIAISIVTSTAQVLGKPEIPSGLYSQQWISNLFSSSAVDEHIITNGTAIMSNSISLSGTAKVTRKTYRVEVSCYTSEVAQTDGSPFIAAKGDHVRYGMVASNKFPIGTLMKIRGVPGVSDQDIFRVEDRMATRYTNNVDIWVTDKDLCLKTIGRRMATIEVIQ